MAQLIEIHLIYVQDYDYYDRYDDSRDLFDRRYSGMGNSGMRGKLSVNIRFLMTVLKFVIYLLIFFHSNSNRRNSDGKT